MREQCMHSAWIVYTLFINSEFCFWRSIITAKKKKKKRKCTFENADAESKLALYVIGNMSVKFIIKFMVFLASLLKKSINYLKNVIFL